MSVNNALFINVIATAQGGLSKFVVTSIHAKETPPTPLRE